MTNKHRNVKLPNWGSLFFGILIGIFATSLIVFMFSTSDITLRIPTGSKQEIDQSGLAAQQTKKDEVEAVVQEPRFEFYTELTKSTATTTEQPKVTVKSEVATLNSGTKAINGYLVQAGLYRKNSDADALKAKLTLGGYAAKIEKFRQRDGEVWHRVMLGPFKSERNAKALQQQLKNLEIDSVIVINYAN
jgi:cell division protein FtsN